MPVAGKGPWAKLTSSLVVDHTSVVEDMGCGFASHIHPDLSKMTFSMNEGSKAE